MLPRKHRLVSTEDYKTVQRLGRSYKGNFFKLSFLSTSDDSPPNVGVIVSNKVSKKSTERNIVRRIVRDFLHEKILELDQGLKVVIIAGQSTIGRTKSELQSDLQSLFDKAFHE